MAVEAGPVPWRVLIGSPKAGPHTCTLLEDRDSEGGCLIALRGGDNDARPLGAEGSAVYLTRATDDRDRLSCVSIP